MTKRKPGGQEGNTNRALKPEEESKRRVSYHVTLPQELIDWVDGFLRPMYKNRSRATEAALNVFRAAFEEHGRNTIVETFDIDDLVETGPGEYKRITK